MGRLHIRALNHIQHHPTREVLEMIRDLANTVIVCVLVVLAVVGWIVLALFVMLLVAAPIVLTAAGCFYAWKAITG